MANSLDDVASQMKQVGIDVPPSVDLAKAFTKYLRWRPSCEKKPKKSAWARLFEYKSPKTGRVYITGAYGLRGDSWQVEATSQDWSPAERAEWLGQRKAAARQADAEREKEAETAAEKARRLWKSGREEGRSAYLDRKKVRAFGLRFGFNAMLMVPLRDVEGTLHGLQWISPDGSKLFGTGVRKEGRFHLIGELAANQPLVFAEGYATAASVHMATGWPVVVCFDAGNIEPVVAQWRKLYPKQALLIAADDDRFLLQRLCDRLARHGVAATPAELARLDQEHEWTVPGAAEGGGDLMVLLKAGWAKDAAGVPFIQGSITISGQATPLDLGVDTEGRPVSMSMPASAESQTLKLENAGRARALSCAKRDKARVFFPVFADAASTGTDWNDLHVAEGLDVCTGQLLRAFEAPEPEKNRASGSPQGGGKKGGPPAGDTDDPEYTDFLSRYTLVYGTTTVWDAHPKVRDLIRIESLKLAHGRLVDWWLGHPTRNMVPAKNVVFDPRGKCQLPEYVNLFDRMPLEPDPHASCKLIVAHLYMLCHENDALFHWVASWLALPLQQPGTKMLTALVLHGRTEGTGKSLMMTVMRRIYGAYARTITQSQLQTDFNGWMSGLLFCVAEEVVSRQDRAHHQGILQDLITGDTVNINEKNMPLRVEENFTNFVFQSNSQIPMLLNKTDRRHTVIKVEREHPPEYFDAILAEMAAGGVEAFYHWLLHYDLQGFNKRTRPFENKDRMHLITLGMQPDQRFFSYWQSGLAGVPFVTCPASDLYTAFKAWCKLNGEKFVPNTTAFGRTVTDELERLGAPEKKKVRYWAYSEKVMVEGDWNEEQVQQQAVVYFVQAAIERRGLGGDAPEGEAQVPPPEALEDATQPDARDARIKLFQAALHALIGSARRAL